MEEGKNLGSSETVKKREEWLDSLRGVSMILIIFSHTASYFSVMNYISKYIYAFYVPIFFLISGYASGISGLDDSVSNGKFLRTSKRLLVPYFTFSLLNFLAASVKGVLRKERFGYYLTKLIQIITTGNGPIWFLLALWLVELVVLVSRLQTRAVFLHMVVVIAGIYLPFVVGNENNAVMTLLCRVLIGTAFYLTGYDLCRYRIFKSETSTAIAVGVLLIGGVSVAALGCDYSLFTGRYASVAGSSVSMICGSVGLLLLFRGIPLQFKLLSAIGRHSMTMLIVHQYIIRVGTFVLFSSGLFQWGNLPVFVHIFAALAYCAVTVAVSFMLSNPMERLFPLFFGSQSIPQKQT